MDNQVNEVLHKILFIIRGKDKWNKPYFCIVKLKTDKQWGDYLALFPKKNVLQNFSMVPIITHTWVRARVGWLLIMKMGILQDLFTT